MGITTTMALRFLEEAAAGAGPWCCFLSFVEPHDSFITHRDVYRPYAAADLPPPPNADDNLNDRPGLYRRAQGIWRQLTEEQKRGACACYYASITEIDAQFGRVLDTVAASGQAENTIVVMMSDHGDLLGPSAGRAWACTTSVQRCWTWQAVHRSMCPIPAPSPIC